MMKRLFTPERMESFADGTLDWFERVFFSARFERLIWNTLLIIIGWFLGYLYFRFQIPV